MLMIEHAWGPKPEPSTGETGLGGHTLYFTLEDSSEIQGHPWLLHNEFKVSLSSMRPYLRKKEITEIKLTNSPDKLIKRNREKTQIKNKEKLQ